MPVFHRCCVNNLMALSQYPRGIFPRLLAQDLLVLWFVGHASFGIQLQTLASLRLEVGKGSREAI